MLKTKSRPHLNRFPYWLRQSVGIDKQSEETKALIRDLDIHTVCQSARCPNIYDCFSKKRCTFLILGRFCTRNCRFCAIETKTKPAVPQKEELFRIKKAVERLGLENVIITSVTRDDLSDGGAGHFKDAIEILRSAGLDEILQPFGLQDELLEKNTPRVHLNIEVLVPDFLGERDSIEKVVFARPDVFSHNIETVPRLYNNIRPKAAYERSLSVLKYAKELNPALLTKSGLMVGLGETTNEVYSVMEDLKEAGCDIITIGQYLKPDSRCLEVEEFLHPDEFIKFSQWAEDLRFKTYSCSPFTRSSYYQASE